MSYIGLRARVLSLGLAVCLLLPTLGIASQQDAELERFHNHRLTSWPERRSFRADPVAYFQRARTWLAERVFPVQAATRLQKGLAYRLLRGTPEARVTLGQDGHVFLNGRSNARLNDLFETACVRAHAPATARALERGLKGWAKTAKKQNIVVDIVIVPTAASIYADKLPIEVPEAYRQACMERTQGRSPLLALQSPDLERLHFLYPLPQMLAHRADAAFFPRANWHPTGLSLQVVRQAYLATLQVPGVVDDTLTLGQTSAEILLPYGIEQSQPTYLMRNANVAVDRELDAQVRAAVAAMYPDGSRFVTHAFSNRKPLIAQSVLMLSDSYGDLGSEVFAGVFQSLIHVNLNSMSGAPLSLVERVRQQRQVDRLLLFYQEGSAPTLPSLNR